MLTGIVEACARSLPAGVVRSAVCTCGFRLVCRNAVSRFVASFMSPPTQDSRRVACSRVWPCARASTTPNAAMLAQIAGQARVLLGR